ncbi:hypothetical protein BCV70DRAFT_203010 [Testicularia cyperi]|uniref:Uncharacterized protein n=1 Tax=Testicularia cyperi TaxID=1882483 RepID=A0A317XFY4_9BASI|nr:hypothetical protein BCV70DRAFT_203010 [Testicularia cyperi]
MPCSGPDRVLSMPVNCSTMEAHVAVQVDRDSSLIMVENTIFGAAAVQRRQASTPA